MQVISILLLLLFLQYSVSVTETYHNTTDIWKQCVYVETTNIFTLNCTNRNFNAILANWPTHKSLKFRAILTGNNFTTLGTLPETKKDVELVLSKCNILNLTSNMFANSQQTKFVDLSYNSIESAQLQPKVFQGILIENKPQNIGIEDLNLGYNQIHTLNKDIFEYLPNLTRLNLEGNDFKVLDIHTQMAVASAIKLTSLNLAANELTELVPDSIKNLNNLVELDLSRNDLDFVPRSLETVGKSLQILKIDENPIIELEWEIMSGLPLLRELSVNNLRITTIRAKTFASNLNLTTISLANNQFLTTIESKSFNLTSPIKEINLSNNNLTDLPLDLITWTDLDILNLSMNPLICSCNLYNIALQVPRKISRRNDGPNCFNPISDLKDQVYNLENDICSATPSHTRRLVSQKLSIPLALLYVVLCIALGAVLILGYTRFRRFFPMRPDSSSSQVLYTPLMNPRL